MNYVFVVDANKKPCNPVHPGWARKLLSEKRAAVLKRYPFTIILKSAHQGHEPSPLRLKLDPGSQTTGVAITDETNTVVFCAEIEHRGSWIKKKLEQRRGVRRSRRNRKVRYRKPRFNNRSRPKGWLPPSLESRISNVTTWVERFSRLAPVAELSMELVKFDTQLMNNPEIKGAAYQQGDLFGYEVKEYLLEKYNRTCVYCGAQNVPLETEHIIPKSRGGSNRVSNLTLACVPCNRKKNDKTAAEFGFPEVQVLAKKPLRDAAAVNASRWALWAKLKNSSLPLETGTGGRTKYNRSGQKYPKAHWIDAACVGESGATVRLQPETIPLSIKATGHGKRQMCAVDKHGFPRSKPKARNRKTNGFQTGDIARADIPKGKFNGKHEGRVVTRASGRFDVGSAQANWKYCTLLQAADGYSYNSSAKTKVEKEAHKQ